MVDERKGLRRRSRTQGSLRPEPATPRKRRSAGSLREPADFEEVNVRNQLQRKNAFQRGLRQGASTIAATAPAVGSIAAGVTGFDKTSRELAESAAEIQERGQKFSQLPRFRDVQEGKAGFGEYLGGLIGSQTPVFASMIGSGGAGGIIGRGAATAGMKQAGRTALKGTVKLKTKRDSLRKAIEAAQQAGRKATPSEAGQLGQATTKFNHALRGYTKLRAKQAARGRRGAQLGAATGAYGSGFGLQSGEAIDILTDDESGRSQQERALAALGGAAVTAGFEALPVMRLLNKMGLARPAKNIVRKELTKGQALGGVVRGSGSQAAIEAGTEVAQGVAMKAAHRLVNENVEIFSDDALEQYFEEGIAGAIIGGLLGGAASVRLPTAGPTEQELEDRIANSKLEQKKAAAKQLGENYEGDREERLDRAQTAAIGGMVLEATGFPEVGDSEYQQARLEVGELLRTLVDPDVTEGQEAEAVRLLSERYGMEVNDNVFQQALIAMRDTEALQIDRLADYLETQREVEEIEGTVPADANERRMLEQQLQLRQRRLAQIQEQIKAEIEEGSSIEETQREGLTDPSGDALEETQPAIRSAFDGSRDSPLAETRAVSAIDAPIVGKLFVSPRAGNLRENSNVEEATKLANNLNETTGSSGQFRAVPAGDTVVRLIRSEIALDDSTTAANNSEVQRRVIDAAQRTAANVKNPRQLKGRELNLREDASLRENYAEALRFLNQYDTVVEEQIPGAVVGRDPQRLTTPEMLQRKIIREPRRDNEALQSKEIEVQDEQGNPFVLDLVALTQTMIGRVDKAGRGGNEEARSQAGKRFEQTGGDGTVSNENIARAVSAGLAEVFTRNGFLPVSGDPAATQQLRELVQQRTQLAQELGSLETGTGGQAEAQNERAESLRSQISEIDSQISSNTVVRDALPSDLTVFRARGGQRATSLGGASLRGAAASRAEIARMTNLADIQRQGEQARAFVEANKNVAKRKEEVATQRERLVALRDQYRAVRAVREVLGEVVEGANPKKLSKLLDEVAAQLFKGKGDVKALVNEALGWPDSKLKGLRTERVALTVQESEVSAPNIPKIKGNERAVSEAQRQLNIAGKIADKNGGRSLVISEGSYKTVSGLLRALFGSRANPASFSTNDAVTLSIAMRKKKGLNADTKHLVEKATADGATIVTTKDQSSEFTKARIEAVELIKSRGYEMKQQGGSLVWTRKRDTTMPQPEVAARTAKPERTRKQKQEPLDRIFEDYVGRHGSFFNPAHKARLEEERAIEIAKKQPLSLSEQIGRSVREDLSMSARARLEREITSLVDQFSEMFNLPAPKILLRDNPSNSRGRYSPTKHQITLNVRRVGPSGALPIHTQFTLIHELSHGLEVETLLNLPTEQFKAVAKEYRAWRADALKRLDEASDRREELGRIFYSKKGPLAVAQEGDLENISDITVLEDYVLDPREWFADSAARLLMEDSFKPTSNSLALDAFREMAGLLRRVFEKLISHRAFDARRDTPQLRNFLINLRTRSTLNEDLLDQRMGEPELSETVKKRLEAIDRQEQFWIERQQRMHSILEQLRSSDRMTVAKRIRLQSQALNVFLDLQRELAIERRSSERSPEQILAEILREDTNTERRRPEVKQSESTVDSPGTEEVTDTTEFGAPPWINRQNRPPESFLGGEDIGPATQANVPSMNQRFSEANRIALEIEDATGQKMHVRVADWAEIATEMGIEPMKLEEVSGLGTIVHNSTTGRDELVIWANESMNMTESARRHTLTNEAVRLTTMLELRKLSDTEAKSLWDAFLESRQGKALAARHKRKQPDFNKLIEGRSHDHSKATKQLNAAGRAFLDFLGSQVNKPTTKFGETLSPIVRSMLKDVTNAPTQFVRDLGSVSDRTGKVSKFAKTWRNAPFDKNNPDTQKAYRIIGQLIERQSKGRVVKGKKKVAKKTAKKKTAKKPSTETGGGGNNNQPPKPPQTPTTPPDDNNPSREDAFNAFHITNAPFTVESFYAMRDLMITRLTAEERRVLGKAFNAQPVRRQIIKFLRDNGALTDSFMDDQFSVLALGYQLYAAGQLDVEASASSKMNKLNAFIHKTAGMLRTSEQAIELMDALNGSAIEMRRSKLMEAAKKDSHLAQGKYALSIADLHELLDILDGAKLFDSKRRSKATLQAIERTLAQNPHFRDLPKTRRQRISIDIKKGVYTKKMLNELLANENDFTVNPEEQFVLHKIFSSETFLQRGAQAMARGMQWFGRFFEIWIGEAMRARFTGNPVVIDFMNSIYTDVTSEGRGEAMFSRKQRRSAEFHGEYLNLIRDLTDDQEQALRDHVLGRKESKDPQVLEAREGIRKLMKKLRRYALDADLPLGDKGADYIPWVFDPVRVANRYEEIVEDWSRSQFDKHWTALARKRGVIKKTESLNEVAKREFIRRIVNGIATENNGLVDSNDTNDLSADKVPPKVGAMFSRDLAFIEENGDAKSKELLSEMFANEINSTIAVYIDQLVKRAEYARTFGKNGEKFMRVRRKAKEFGADTSQIELLDKMANSVLGRTGLEVSPFWKALMAPIENIFMQPVMADDGKPFKTAKEAAKVKREKSIKGRVIENPEGAGFIIDRKITNDPRRFRQTNALLVVYQNFTILGLAAFTNTADAAGILFRTGSFNIAFRSYVDAIKETVNSIKTIKMSKKERRASMTDLRKMAEDLGIVEFSVISDINGQLYGGNMMDGTAKRWNDKFFRWNGMEHLTRTLRLSAFAAGKRYLTSAARRAADGDPDAVRELAEVDLVYTDLSFDENGEIQLMTRGQAEDILAPYNLSVSGARDQEISQANFDRLTDPKAIERQQAIRKVARDDRVKQALNRMVDESVLRPAPTQRPTWMNNPNWQLFSHLKGFMFTYHERVLRRAYTSAAQGRYGPMMAMSSYVGMIMAMDALRAVIQHGPRDDDDWRPEMTFGQRLQDAGRRSGVYGSLGFFADMHEATQFNSNLFAEAGGPTTSHVNRLWRAFVSGRTSMRSAFERSLPGSQVFVDIPESMLDWTHYFYGQTGLPSLDNPVSLMAFEETPVVGEAVQFNAHRLRLRQ